MNSIYNIPLAELSQQQQEAENDMTNYVAGFMFNIAKPGIAPRECVALIEKQRPDWQKGKLNGIGGKIDSGESPADAMAREFLEETGVKVAPERWRSFCELRFRGATIHFFASEGELSELRSMEDEHVTIVDVSTIWNRNTIPNLRWLIPMALDKDRVTAVVEDLS